MLANLIVWLFVLLPTPALAQGGLQGPGPNQGPTSLTVFETADFSGSGICAACHGNLKDGQGNDVSIDTHWRSTMMANAAKDPLWLAKISSEVVRNPDLEAVIEEKCSRCHMGMARYQAVTDGSSVDVFGTGFLDPANDLHDAAMDGVSCTLCHQIQPTTLGTPDSYTGKYVIDTLSSPPNRLIFGPFDQPLQRPMQPDSGFAPTPGSQVTDSALCGSCHTLYTPSVWADGTPVGFEFPEQTTYLEWAHSSFAKSCQDCHLPAAAGAVVISNRPRRLTSRSPFGQHHFVGGNSFMVGLLKTNARALGVTAEPAHFDGTISRTLSQLQQKTALLTVAAKRIGDRLEVTVGVENLAGHKLPSGLPSRRSWLHVSVTDGQGVVVFESGRPRADGSIEGNDADDAVPSTWEPHYDIITEPDQVQIYEPIMLTPEGEVTYTLLRCYSYAKDNRLLPAGFDKAGASVDIAVYGEAADDEDFTGGADQITYDIDLAGATGSMDITVELLYQTVSYPFIVDLAKDETDLVNQFMVMYDPAENAPLRLDAEHASAP
jgi:hypothetical protein